MKTHTEKNRFVSVEVFHSCRKLKRSDINILLHVLTYFPIFGRVLNIMA